MQYSEIDSLDMLLTKMRYRYQVMVEEDLFVFFGFILGFSQAKNINFDLMIYFRNFLRVKYSMPEKSILEIISEASSRTGSIPLFLKNTKYLATQ